MQTPMLKIREHQPEDETHIDPLALDAFAQFKNVYRDWPAFQAKIGKMSALAKDGEIIVAEINSQIAGAVAYLGPGAPKAPFFRPEWSIMRMLVVSPDFRNRGIGQTLAQECLCRAKRDGTSTFALHTGEHMEVALAMYRRLGFKWKSSAPPIHGVPYGIYVKKLDC